MTNQQQNGTVEETGSSDTHSSDNVIDRIGYMTRMLHDSLHELGYSKRLKDVASNIPDAYDRLSYVGILTEQAAERALNATEIAKPIQDKLAADAAVLSKLWQQFDVTGSGQFDSDAGRDLVEQTRSYLSDVPSRTSATNVQLMEVIMAQDFQDLTGQVMKKVIKNVQVMEHELLQLLVDSVPIEKKEDVDEGMLAGPVVNPSGRIDVVTDQDEVDDLLKSLGF